MRLPRAMCATVPEATTVLTVLQHLPAPVAAAPVANTAAVMVTQGAPPVLVASIKTQVLKRAARLVQG